MIHLNSNQIYNKYGVILDSSVQINPGVEVNNEQVKILVTVGQNYDNAARKVVHYDKALHEKYDTLPACTLEEQKQSTEYQQLVKAEQEKEAALAILTNLQKLGYSLLKA